MFPYDYRQMPQNIPTMHAPQPQASLYFVKSPQELPSFNLMPNNYFVGLNQDNKEIYVRRMNNDGKIEVESYVLKEEVKEKTDIEKIFDRLDGIEKKLSEMPTQRPVLTLKGRADERASKPSNE